VEGQALWQDEALAEVRARSAESRFVVIGLLEGKHWSAAVTYRGETMRLVSVRRARAKEVEAYEGK
jgi:uncharacterized DUF497 family protein